ncbi:hypothetical protein PVAP13_3KG096027 [Panicum virgatum]|uniref:Uncharacterized protein n=1 Tax=Panicum virgatum TaxID=38727 RepID=A0A8T0UPK3_PANVG|nr:hypothetical protein PVAP13_3KG096027 [Panicum virgatum]
MKWPATVVLVYGTRSAGSPAALSPLVGAASAPAPATLLPAPFLVLRPDHRRGKWMKPVSLMARVRDKVSWKAFLDGKLQSFP